MSDSEQYQNVSRMSESQKIALRKLLNHYQDRAVNTQQFRILQGVLTSDFSLMEVKRKAR